MVFCLVSVLVDGLVVRHSWLHRSSLSISAIIETHMCLGCGVKLHMLSADLWQCHEDVVTNTPHANTPALLLSCLHAFKVLAMH